jgi:hypothetical protein
MWAQVHISMSRTQSNKSARKQNEGTIVSVKMKTFFQSKISMFLSCQNVESRVRHACTSRCTICCEMLMGSNTCCCFKSSRHSLRMCGLRSRHSVDSSESDSIGSRTSLSKIGRKRNDGSNMSGCSCTKRRD